MAIDNKDKKILKSSIEREQNELACSAECEKIKGSKNLNVPLLRFPEFNGEWEKKRISEFCTLLKGTGISKDQLSTNGNPCILYGELYTKYKAEIINEVLSRTELDANTLVKSKVNDVIIPCSGETAIDIATARCVPFDDVLLGGDLNILRSNKVNGSFLAYQLNGKRKYDIARVAQGVSVVHLYGEHLKNIVISLPVIEEQQKISRLLHLLDERIASQNKIIEDLKKLKSAIVDKLYSSAKGETYSFRQLFEVVNEKNKKLIYSNVLSASQELGMIERSDINIDIKFEQNSISEYKIVRKGDYVVHLRSFQGGFAFSDRTGICSPAYTILHPNDLVAYGYLSHFFISKPFIKSLKLVTYGIRDGRSINVDEWLDMTVTLPTKREQSHILAIINAIDNKLHNENQIHNYMFRQRTYLLKTMFI